MLEDERTGPTLGPTLGSCHANIHTSIASGVESSRLHVVPIAVNTTQVKAIKGDVNDMYE